MTKYVVKIKTVGIWDCKVCGKIKASKDVLERRRRNAFTITTSLPTQSSWVPNSAAMSIPQRLAWRRRWTSPPSITIPIPMTHV
ncbi:unnamed protein product, partial [Vitis vinifera]|uniref:Uncharacterized protein n=1 Tax=Vitis vinifera TaxID=29760 RepID=D7TMP6_VITVI